MSTTVFNFLDGKGPIPAHEHSFGGGWVANTAHVDVTAYIGAQARVYGEASVYGKAHVYGGSWGASPPQIIAGRWYCCVPVPGRVRVGCQDHSYEYWRGDLGVLRAEYMPTELEIASITMFLDLVKYLGLDQERA